jgi:predicted SAM-dependent methyltransferase
MKINIGCGKKYEPGYVNIDLYESLVADKLMPATNLTLDDNSSEEIKAIQLIEHLTFFEGIYVLSEFYRVLKPGGNLIIETPDLKKACEYYITSTDEQKKEALGWLYGIPHKGLQHKLCYPPFLLKDVLENVGFEDLNLSYYINGEDIPTLKCICEKNENLNMNEPFQTISHLRKELITQNKIDFTDSYVCKEQEDCISFIGSKLIQKKKMENRVFFYDLIVGLLIKWPESVNILLSILKTNIGTPNEIAKITEATSILIECDIVNFLYNFITKAPLRPGSQKLVINFSELFARKLIDDFLNSKITKEILIEKLKIPNKPIEPLPYELFSALLVEKYALDQYYLGIKAYHQENYSHAYNLFLGAIKLHKDNFKFFWYLAKSLIQLHSYKQAGKIYKKTLYLLKRSEISNKEDVKSQIQNEIIKLKLLS